MCFTCGCFYIVLPLYLIPLLVIDVNMLSQFAAPFLSGMGNGGSSNSNHRLLDEGFCTAVEALYW